MTTVERVVRTEFSPTVKDLEIEVYKRRNKKGFKRSVVNNLAWGAFLFSASSVAWGAVDLLTDHDYSAPKIVVVYGGFSVAGGIGYAGLSRRVKRYDIEIARLDAQDSALLAQHRVERESEENAAKTVVPSASE